MKAESAESGFRALLNTDIALIITDVSMPDISTGLSSPEWCGGTRVSRELPSFLFRRFAQSELDQLHGLRYRCGRLRECARFGIRFSGKGQGVSGSRCSHRRELEMLKQKLEERVAERTAELEASREQLKVLVREMQHRCKNLLAVVQSLATEYPFASRKCGRSIKGSPRTVARPRQGSGSGGGRRWPRRAT